MIHTFQLVTPSLSFRRYRHIEDRVYERAKLGLCKIVKSQEKLLCFLLPSHLGLRLCLNSLTIPRIEMVVNPSLILSRLTASASRLPFATRLSNGYLRNMETAYVWMVPVSMGLER